MKAATDEARKLYLELAEHTSMIGAYSFAKGTELGHLRLGERTSELAQIFEEVLSEPTAEDESGHLLFRVPSPWHAVIHLLANNRGWLSGKNGLGRQMALLYRGQRDSTWPLTPSIYREGVNFETESRVIYAFVNLVDRFLRSQFQCATDIISPSLMMLSDRFAAPTPKAISRNRFLPSVEGNPRNLPFALALTCAAGRSVRVLGRLSSQNRPR